MGPHEALLYFLADYGQDLPEGPLADLASILIGFGLDLTRYNWPSLVGLAKMLDGTEENAHG